MLRLRTLIAGWYANLADKLRASAVTLASKLRVGAYWLAMTVAAMLGMFGSVDGWLFDRMATLPPRAEPAPEVAVVRYPGRDAGGPAAATGAELSALANRIRNAGASAVVMVVERDAIPVDGSRGVLGQGLALDEPGDGCVPLSGAGVARELPLSGSQGQACLIARAARLLGLPQPPTARISPDFSIRTATGLPSLRSAQADSPTLLRQIVAGRTVVLYPEPDPPVYVTPLYATDGLMEASTLHALTLDSALRGRAMRWLQPPVDVLFALLAALALHLWLRRRSYRFALIALALAPIPVLLVGIGLLRVAHVYLPMTATLVAIGAYLLRHVIHRNVALASTLVELDHQLTGIVQRPLGAAFDLPADVAWDSANRFVAQFFDLQRSLMLRLPPGQVHLQAASAIGCSIDDIVETRRDYRRTPYLTAIAMRRPAQLEKPYLPADADLVDFLAPLIVAEELVGFWAFSVTKRPGSDLDVLSHEAAVYADEIAKVVLHASGNQAPGETSMPRRFTTLVQTRSRLFNAISQVRAQLAAFREVFASVGHPIAVADMFGRVQFSNQRFEQYAAALGKPLLAMSVNNILEQLCGLSPAAAKDVMRYAMTRQDTDLAGLPVTVAAPIAYSLHLRPIRHHERDAHVYAVGSPFDAIGLALELSPSVSPEVSLVEIRRSGTLSLSRITACGGALTTLADALPDNLGLRDQMGDRIKIVLAETARLGQLLRATGADEKGDAVPVDLRRLLERARHEVMGDAAAKSLSIDLEGIPSLSVQLRLAPLRPLLVDILRLLIEDAGPGTPIRIDAQASDDRAGVVVRFAGSGYGLPDWHVAEIMRRRAVVVAGAPQASALQAVATGAQGLDPTLSLQVASEVGRGFVVELMLPRSA